MRSLISALAALSLVCVTVLAAMPWGLAPDYRFVLPHLPFAAIHYWTLRDPGRIPIWLIFACGVAIDVASGGPLGFWPLVFLAGYGIAALEWPFSKESRIGRWLIFLSVLVILVTLEWGMASLYYLQLMDWKPFALAAFFAGLAYPPEAFLLHLTGSGPEPRSNPSLVRGR